MASEPIPGMADRIRDTLKRRVHGDLAKSLRIDALTVEQVYSQAPEENVRKVVEAAPSDKSDIREWTRYLQVAGEALDTKAMNEWIKNLQDNHDLSPRGKKKGAA